MSLGIEHSGARPASRVGTWIRGEWFVDDLVGVGASSAVYAATHRTGARAALKILHRRFLRSSDTCTRFQRELEIARRVAHPARVRIDGLSSTDDGALFLVMELLDGVTLHAALSRIGRLRPVAALMIADELLDFLQCCHDGGVVHRDIKTSNVVLTTDGAVRILDFGVARLTGRLYTGPNVAVGTPATMAPEQAWADPDLDGRVDVFGIGALLFHALSGEPIRELTTLAEVVRRAALAPVRPLHTVVPDDVPRSLCALVDRALAFDRDKRFRSAAAMREQVHREMAQLDSERGILARIASGDTQLTRDNDTMPCPAALTSRLHAP